MMVFVTPRALSQLLLGLGTAQGTVPDMMSDDGGGFRAMCAMQFAGRTDVPCAIASLDTAAGFASETSRCPLDDGEAPGFMMATALAQLVPDQSLCTAQSGAACPIPVFARPATDAMRVSGAAGPVMPPGPKAVVPRTGGVTPSTPFDPATAFAEKDHPVDHRQTGEAGLSLPLSSAPAVAPAIAQPLTPVTVPHDHDAVITRQLDMTADTMWLQSLARDIAETASGSGRLCFTLVPKTLGRLDVAVQQDAAGLSVRMTTTHDAARDALTAAQPRIVEEIRAAGVRVASADVCTDAGQNHGDRRGNTPPQRQPASLIDHAVIAPADHPRVTPRPTRDRFA
jgi:hypothetical protein